LSTMSGSKGILAMRSAISKEKGRKGERDRGDDLVEQPLHGSAEGKKGKGGRGAGFHSIISLGSISASHLVVSSPLGRKKGKGKE